MEPRNFRYTARTVEGDLIRGTMAAATPEFVLSVLRTRALFVTAIDREGAVGRTLSRALRIGGVSRHGLLTFFRSFSTLIRAGVSMRRSLTVTIERTTDAALREALRSLLADIEQGSALSDAMARRPRVFAPLYVAMIRAGETGGILDDVLARLAVLLERDGAVRQKVRAALAYPAVVLTAATGLILFLIAKIVPMFSTMFESFHVELPFTTRLLLSLGITLGQPIVWIGSTVIVSSAALLAHGFVKTERGAILADRLRLRLPIAGALMHRAIVARTARMIGTLLGSGIELVAAIDAVIPVCGSVLYARAFANVNAALRQGESLAQPLADAAIFDPMFLALTRVGEETGLVDEMLYKIAEYFEADVEATIATLGAVIEPVLMVVLGGVVGFIVFSIFIPLYSLIGSVAK